MGDAGSTMIGFTIVWILLETAGKTHPLTEVTALWIIAYPADGHGGDYVSPPAQRHESLSPDRQHIHRLVMRAGFTSRQAFVLITTGRRPCWRWLTSWRSTPALYLEWVMLILFATFFLYGYCIKRGKWRAWLSTSDAEFGDTAAIIQLNK